MNYKNYYSMEPIDVWNLVRRNKLPTFPPRYLDKESCILLVRTLFIDELQLSREKILKTNLRFLSKYQLGGVRIHLGCKMYDILTKCFPELDIKCWELSNVYPNFWKNKKNRTDFIKWVAKKENLDLYNIEDIKKLSIKTINKYGGSIPIKEAGGLFALIYPAIPKKLNIKEWQVMKVGIWNKEKAINAIKWLIEEKLNWSDKQVYENLSASIFYQNNLGGLLSKFCHHSPLEAINLAYPGKFDTLKNIKPDFLHH